MYIIVYNSPPMNITSPVTEAGAIYKCTMVTEF